MEEASLNDVNEGYVWCRVGAVKMMMSNADVSVAPFTTLSTALIS